MSAIVPAILPTSRQDLEKKLDALRGHIDSVQIDIVDGRFATPASWPYGEDAGGFAARISQGETLPHLGNLHYEMDLMITDPEQVVGLWIAAGAQRLTLHCESSNYLTRVFDELESRYGHAKGFAPNLLSVGIAINLQTDIGMLDQYMDRVDYVQLMGIARIGHQGERFDMRVLRKITSFRDRHPGVPIQLDGGVSLETAPALLSAGVSRLIIGSALWEAPDLLETLERFKELVHEYGIY